MRFGPRTVGSLAAGVLVLAGSVGCEDNKEAAGATGGTTSNAAARPSSGGPTGTPTATAGVPTAAAPKSSAPAAAERSGVTVPKPLPNFVGQGLQSAQDGAQAAGFTRLKSTDALGQNRNQVLDRNWKVCAQDPRAGLIDSDATITFATVKLEETCPSTAAAEAPSTTAMPDLIGKGVKVARGALPTGASVTVTDVSGDGRLVIVESNWKVCTQEPAAGAAYPAGRPVRLGAAKTNEKCG